MIAPASPADPRPAVDALVVVVDQDAEPLERVQVNGHQAAPDGQEPVDGFATAAEAGSQVA